MEKKCLRKKRDNLWVLFNGQRILCWFDKRSTRRIRCCVFCFLKKVGTALKQGDTLVELEAEKLSVNFQAH